MQISHEVYSHMIGVTQPPPGLFGLEVGRKMCDALGIDARLTFDLEIKFSCDEHPSLTPLQCEKVEKEIKKYRILEQPNF